MIETSNRFNSYHQLYRDVLHGVHRGGSIERDDNSDSTPRLRTLNPTASILKSSIEHNSIPVTIRELLLQDLNTNPFDDNDSDDELGKRCILFCYVSVWV
jgi:hypothetical protein